MEQHAARPDPPGAPVEQRAAIESDPRLTNFAQAIRAAGERPLSEPGTAGIGFLDHQGELQWLSFSDLWLAARRIAAGLRARGVREGDRIVVLLPTSEAYVTAIAGAIVAGIVPCTVAAPMSRAAVEATNRHLSHIQERLEPALYIVPENLKAALQENPAILADRVLVPDELQADQPLAIEDLPVLSPDHTLHIQLTSGSTSHPKGVVLTHRNALSNLQAIAHAMDYAPATDRILSWLPFYHDMGFVQLLTVLYYQSALYLMTPTSFLRNPLAWLQNISRHQISLCAAPTFAYRLCVQRFDADKLQGVDLASWRRAYVGAEPVPLSVLEDFAGCFRSHGFRDDTLYPCYGMAETVLATTLPVRMPADGNQLFGFVRRDRIDPGVMRGDGEARPAADPESALDVPAMGCAVRGLEVCIRDTEGRLLPDRAVGEICVRGTSLMQSYYQDPEATTAAVRDGWYYTGDRGYLVNGELYVLGRIKELLIVRGRNYEPYDIEGVIEEHEAVRGGYTVVFGVNNPDHGTDDVIAVIETRTGEEEKKQLAQQVQQSLQQVFGFVAHDIVFVRPGTIPRTTSGKRQRVLSREQYLAGKFA